MRRGAYAKVLIAITVIGLMPAWASAALTLEERASLAQLQIASSALTQHFANYGADTVSLCTTQANHVEVAAAVEISALVLSNLNDAVVNYLTANPSAAYTLSRTKMYAVYGLQLWTALRAHTKDPVCKDIVDRATWRLSWANDALNAFSPALAYADPFPSPLTPGGFHTLIGPHGVYETAQAYLWRSVFYYVRALDDVRQAVRIGPPVGGYADLGRPYRYIAQAAANSHNAMFVYAGVSAPKGNRFFDVLDALQLLTTKDSPGTPFQLRELSLQFAATYLPKLGRNPTWDSWAIDAMVVVQDAWMHSDHAAWSTMVFPDCSILTDPTGCGGL